MAPLLRFPSSLWCAQCFCRLEVLAARRCSSIFFCPASRRRARTGTGECPRAAAATRSSALSTLERIRCGEPKEISADDACRLIERAFPSAWAECGLQPFLGLTCFMFLMHMPAHEEEA